MLRGHLETTPPEQWGQWRHTNTRDMHTTNTKDTAQALLPLPPRQLEKRNKKNGASHPNGPSVSRQGASLRECTEGHIRVIRTYVCSSPDIIYHPFSAENMLKKPEGSWETYQPSTSSRLTGFIKVGSGSHERCLHCSRNSKERRRWRKGWPPGDRHTNACSTLLWITSALEQPCLPQLPSLRKAPAKSQAALGQVAPGNKPPNRGIQLTQGHSFREENSACQLRRRD